MITLSPEWTELLETYESEHSDPRNQFFHDVGIPLVVASLLVAVSGIGVTLAAWIFTAGIVAQLAGHVVEGSKPFRFDDPRRLVISLIWWAENRGVRMQRAVKSEVEAEA